MPQENSKILSIVIPVFNEINFLDKLFQQLKLYFNKENIELIVVDDGSTDGSSDLLKQIKINEKYKFIFKIIKLDINSGKGKAIQTGIKNSDGEYILLQDADLELDTKDAKEMFDMITSNEDIKCAKGTRLLQICSPTLEPFEIKLVENDNSLSTTTRNTRTAKTGKTRDKRKQKEKP